MVDGHCNASSLCKVQVINSVLPCTFTRETSYQVGTATYSAFASGFTSCCLLGQVLHTAVSLVWTSDEVWSFARTLATLTLFTRSGGHISNLTWIDQKMGLNIPQRNILLITISNKGWGHILTPSKSSSAFAGPYRYCDVIAHSMKKGWGIRLHRDYHRWPLC